MSRRGARLTIAVLFALACAILPHLSSGLAQDQPAVTLPQGVKAVWDPAKAFHQTTPTCERICINGLWRWQPAPDNALEVPSTNWGYFKVPAPWPGIQDYLHPAARRAPASVWCARRSP